MDLETLAIKIKEFEDMMGEENRIVLKIKAINIIKRSTILDFKTLTNSIEPIKEWINFDIVNQQEFIQLWRYKIKTLNCDTYVIENPKCNELLEESKLREDEKLSLVSSSSIGSSMGFGYSDFLTLSDSKDKTISEYRKKSIPRFTFRFSNEQMDSEKLNKIFKYFNQFVDENGKQLCRNFLLITSLPADIFILGNLHEAIGYSDIGVKVDIQIGTYTDPSTILNYSDKFSCFEVNKAYLIKKSHESYESSLITNCKLYVNQNASFTRVGNYYFLFSIEAISGTISHSNYEFEPEIHSWLESDQNKECYITLPVNQVTNVICRSFLILKQLTKMNIPRMTFEVNLKEWCSIEYVSEADSILELPKASYISLKVFSQDKGKFPDNSYQLSILSHDPRVIPKEERESLIIYTKMFLDLGWKSIEFADILWDKDAKSILAHLMEPNSLHSVTMVNPIFKMTPIIMDHLLKQNNIFSLNVFSKGKDYLSEVVRDRSKNMIHRYFYKNIFIEFQLPINIQNFSNSTTL